MQGTVPETEWIEPRSIYNPLGRIPGPMVRIFLCTSCALCNFYLPFELSSVSLRAFLQPFLSTLRAPCSFQCHKVPESIGVEEAAWRVEGDTMPPEIVGQVGGWNPRAACFGLASGAVLGRDGGVGKEQPEGSARHGHRDVYGAEEQATPAGGGLSPLIRPAQIGGASLGSKAFLAGSFGIAVFDAAAGTHTPLCSLTATAYLLSPPCSFPCLLSFPLLHSCMSPASPLFDAASGDELPRTVVCSCPPPPPLQTATSSTSLAPLPPCSVLLLRRGRDTSADAWLLQCAHRCVPPCFKCTLLCAAVPEPNGAAAEHAAGETAAWEVYPPVADSLYRSDSDRIKGGTQPSPCNGTGHGHRLCRFFSPPPIPRHLPLLCESPSFATEPFQIPSKLS